MNKNTPKFDEGISKLDERSHIDTIWNIRRLKIKLKVEKTKWNKVYILGGIAKIISKIKYL